MSPFPHARLLLLAVLLSMTGTLFAQAPGTGAITGVVCDPAGLAVENAKVSLTNEATHSIRSAMTGQGGQFTAELLVPGSYLIGIDAPGFEEKMVHSVQVVVSETSSLSVRLSIANVGTKVEVQADREIAQTQSSTLGRATDERAIQSLPLSNRNYTQILALSPGVVVSVPNAATLGRGTLDVSANGNKTTANNLQFNGVDANNLAQNSAASDGEEVGVAVPAPDTIQEFKVQTANYDASYGRGTGANVDVISKAGTNRFHGTAWEFLRNDDLNANDFFLKRANQPRPVLKQNQFGAAVGGPVLHNKTFFFGAYQGLRSSNGLGDRRTSLLPQLTTDRSAATLGAQFCPYATHAGGTQVACDGSNINPAALAVLNFKFPNGQYAIPSPQINLPPTDPTQIPIGQSVFSIPATYNEDQYTANIDHNLTEKNVLSGRFFYSRAPTIAAFSPNAATVPGWGTSELDQNTMFVLTDTHVFTSNIVNAARFGFIRFDGVTAVQNPILASDLGIGSPTGTTAAGTHAPGITIDGLFTIGDAGTPSQSQVTNTFVWQDTVSWTHGRHNVRFGGEAKRHQVMVDAPFTSDGLLDIRTFNDFLLGQNAAQNGSPNGLSNVTNSTGSSGLFRKDERYIDFAGFAQDDIQVSPRLVVNAGLRYEVFGAPSELHGRFVSFDPGIAAGPVPAEGSLSGFIVPSNFEGAVPQGVLRSSDSGLYGTNYHDVSPRFGFVLRLADRPTLLLRGGYGIYFDRLSGGLAESLLGQAPFSTIQNLSEAANGGASLQSPFAPLLPAPSSFPQFLPRVPDGNLFIDVVTTHATDPYTQEYNLNVQYGLAQDYLFELGYVGTRSLHVVGSLQFNQALLASPANPINGVTTNTAGNVGARLPLQGVAPGSLITNTNYFGNYNGLQASITKRFTHGLEFLGSYTWSRNLDVTSGSGGSQLFEASLITNDQNNLRQAYGLDDFDRTHRGVLSLVYETPKYRMLPSFVQRSLAWWQVSGILVAQSGTPITVLDGNAGTVYGNFPFENRAETNGQNPGTPGSTFTRVDGYLNRAAFIASPLAPNGVTAGDTDFGNSGTGILRGPGQRNIDLAMEKAFPITETSALHFRSEFFNLTNTTNFSNPSNSLDAGPGFGLITGTAANPRIIQFALKYSF